MPTYQTFGDDEPEPTKQNAKLRTEWQSEKMTPIVVPLVGEASYRSEDMESRLKGIYKPLVAEAKTYLEANHMLIARQINTLGNHLRGRIESQQARINQLPPTPPNELGGGTPDEANCPPGSTRVAGLCAPIPPVPPARGGGRPPRPPRPPGPPPIPPPIPPPQPGPGPNPTCGTPDTEPCLPPEPIQCAPGEIPVIVAGVVIGCLPPCPVGYHYVYLPPDPYPHCIRNPPSPPPCVGDGCGLGCGPVGCCDVGTVGNVHSICDPVGNLVVKAAQSSHVPSELWGPDPSGGITSGPYALYIGARPPVGHPPMRLSGPAPLADIIHGSVSILPPDALVKTYVYADPVPPPLGTICPDGGGPCPEAKCPDGFHWEQQSDGSWKCVPDPKTDACKDLLKAHLPQFHVDDKKIGDKLVIYTEVFGKMGSDIRTAIDGAWEVADLLISLEKLIIPIPLIGKIISWFTGNTNGLATYWEDLRCTLKGLSLVKDIWGQDLLLGLYFAKAMVRAFEHIRVGWDAFAWITGDITFELKELDQLIEYLIKRITRMELPTSREALRLHYAEKWPEDWAKSIINMNGETWQVTHDMYHAERERISPMEAVHYGWRKGWKSEQFTTDLKSYGIVDQEDVDRIIEMRKEVPPPSDVIHFVVREAFNLGKLGRDEMLEELKLEVGFRDMARAVGLTNIEIADKDGVMQPYDVPALHWLAHYQEISPTQGYEMLHRLRPDRVEHFKTFVPGVTPDQLKVIMPGAKYEFDPVRNGTTVTPPPMDSLTLAKLLRQQEYNPIWRARLEAISYHVLGRIDARRMYNTGVFGPPKGRLGFTGKPPGDITPTGVAEIELKQRFQDMGFTPDDSILQAYFVAGLYEDVNKKLDKRWIKDICTAYTVGVIDLRDATDQLTEAFNGDEDAADEFLRICDVEKTLGEVKTAKQAIRAAFLIGEYDEPRATQEMTSIGFVPTQISIDIRLWKLQLAARTKQGTASMFCQWYAEGSIRIDEMYQRLRNIQFSEGDARRIVNHCQIGILAKEAAERDRLAKAELAEQRRLMSQIERDKAKAEAAANKALREFLQPFTDKHIADWWRDRLISRETVRLALQLKGWAPEQIDEYLREYLR